MIWIATIAEVVSFNFFNASTRAHSNCYSSEFGKTRLMIDDTTLYSVSFKAHLRGEYWANCFFWDESELLSIIATHSWGKPWRWPSSCHLLTIRENVQWGLLDEQLNEVHVEVIREYDRERWNIVRQRLEERTSPWVEAEDQLARRFGALWVRAYWVLEPSLYVLVRVVIGPGFTSSVFQILLHAWVHVWRVWGVLRARQRSESGVCFSYMS